MPSNRASEVIQKIAKKIRGQRVLATLWLLLFLAPKFAVADCSVLPSTKELARVKLQPPGTEAKVAEVSQYQQQIFLLTQQTAQQIFDRYLQRRLDKTTQVLTKTCLEQIESIESVSRELSLLIFNQTRERLLAAKSPMLRNIGERISLNKVSSFRVYNHFSKDRGVKKAGFHRGERSLFIDLVQTEPDEFLSIFIHEFGHANDEIFFAAIEAYADEDAAKMAARLQPNEWETLPTQQQKRIKDWIMAGLNRGLLAEWRVWTMVFKAYLEGRQTGDMQTVLWMENVLKQKPQNISLENHIFNFLDQNFTNPNDGPYSNPELVRVLEMIRDELRTQPKTFY